MSRHLQEAKNIEISGVQRLPPTKIEVGSYLGAGAFGDVYQATYHYRPGYHLPIARKTVTGAKVNLSEAQQYEAFEWEVMRLASVSHPNLVHFYGYHQEGENLYLDMEYCSGGTLENLLKRGRLSLSRCWQIALDLAQGLAYLEHHGIVHRDLKPDNILLDERGCAKLADLGIAQVDILVQASEARSVTTLKAQPWAAPEELLGEPASSASDRYSLGLILWFMITGKNPTTLPGFVIKELNAQNLEARLSALETALKRETPAEPQAQSLYNLIGSLLARNPQERIRAENLVARLYQLSTLHPEGGVLQSVQISCVAVEEQREVLLDYLPLHVVTRPLQEDPDIYWQRFEKDRKVKSSDKEDDKESSERPETITSEAPQSLEDNFQRFLADPNQPVFVLFGEGGLGKSLSTYQLAQGLLRQVATDLGQEKVPLDRSDIFDFKGSAAASDSSVFYGHVGEPPAGSTVFYGHVDQTSSVSRGIGFAFHRESFSSPLRSLSLQRLPSARPDTEWLPIFIRPGIPTWAHSQLTNGLVTCLKNHYHLDDKAIAALKQKRVVFIVDGYDELQKDAAPQNLPTQLGLAAFPNAKLIVTSRLSAISPGEESRRFGFNGRLADYYLLPLSITQLLNALEQRLSLSSGEQDRYAQQLKEASGLRTALRNPFVLNLFIQSFATLSRQGLETLSRVGIYAGFIRHWLTTQHNLIPESIQHSLLGVHPTRITSFCRCAESLAFDAYQQKVLLVEEKPYANEKTYPWLHLQKLIRDYSRDEFTKRRAAAADSSQRRALLSEDDYIGFMQSKANYFMTLNPLKQRADGRWNFVHKSFFEYFVACFLLGAIDRIPLAALKHLNHHPIQEELGIVNFFTEMLEEESEKREAREGVLFQLIEASKTKPSVAQSAANAVTLLNAARVSFSGRDFAGVCIPGADLSRAILDTTNFEGADLNRIKIAGAWIRQTNLKRAQMHDVDWGEWPYLKLPKYVNACAYSPDGRWLAVAPDGRWLAVGSDFNVYLYNAKHRTLHHILKGHAEGITCVAFDPTSERLASGSRDRTVCLWEVKSGQLLMTFDGHGGTVESVVFDPSGECLVSGSTDMTVRAWRVATGKGEYQFELEGHTGNVWKRMDFDPKGEYLASGIEYIGTVHLWRVATGLLEHTLKGHTNSVNSIAFDLKGEYLATGGDDDTVRLWLRHSGRLIYTLEGHTGYVTSVAFDPKGEYLASGSADNTVRLWRLATGRLERTLEGHTDIVWKVAFDPAGECLASVSNDKTVRLWQVARSQLIPTFEGHMHYVCSVAFDNNGKYLATGSWDKTVRLWRVAITGRLELERVLEGHREGIKSVAFDPTGKYLASGSYDKTVRLWLVATGQLERIFEGHRLEVFSVAFDPTGKYLASGSGGTEDGEKTVRLWEVATGWLKCTLDVHMSVSSIAFDPQGKRLASGSHGGIVHLWRAATGQLECTLKGHPNWVTSVAFDATGERLASGSLDKTVRLWQAATGRLERTLEGHTDGVHSVAFDPKGKYLASGGGDNTVRLWLVATGACLAVIQGFTDAVFCVSFQPSLSSLFLATGGRDKTVRYWQIDEAKGEKGKLRAMLRWTSHQAALTAVDACIDGVIGLDSTGRDLLQQRGAKGMPAEVKDHNSNVKSSSAPRNPLFGHSALPPQPALATAETQASTTPASAAPQQHQSPALFQSRGRVSGPDTDLELKNTVVLVAEETSTLGPRSSSRTAATHTVFNPRRNQGPPISGTTSKKKKSCPCVIL